MRLPHYLTIFLKGIAMGAADIVPGVSGGTIAFITGIYEELINTLKSIHPGQLGTLFRQGPKAFWQAVNGHFLASLLAGIVTSFLTLAHMISYLMESYPLMLWSFFFGLVLASGIHIGRLLRLRCPVSLLLLVAGAVFAYIITMMQPTQLQPSAWMVFAAGAVAICAMILPGISGSFILLLLGMYSFVIAAIKSLDADIIAVFLLGCVTGLLSFVHVLSWLLRHYRNMTLAALTGFLLGSLNALWPWKTVDRVIESGDKTVEVTGNVWPWVYQELTAQPPMITYCLLCAAAGIVIVLSLEKTAAVEA